MGKNISGLVREALFGSENILMDVGEGKRCSAFAAGKDATVDGSTINAYTCDGPCDFRLELIPAAAHEDGEEYIIDYKGIKGGSGHTAEGKIPEVPYTNAIFSAEVPVANDKQVFISENTCLSKMVLSNLKEGEGLLDYHSLPALTLQRAATASEAVDTMGALVEKYGFQGGAESFIISDPNEVWNVEVVGDSTIWVAQRIPDNAVIYHANRLRIQKVDMDDHDKFRGSENLVSWPIEKGVYDPEKHGEFSFERVYSAWRYMISSVRREWRAFSLLCPDREWADNAAAYPYYVFPKEKISIKWVMTELFRDTYAGTKYDLSKGYGAGPFGNPMRQVIKGVGRESPIGTWTSTYSTVCQARRGMPDALGGLMWYCQGTSRTSVWTPIYCGVKSIPESYRMGDYTMASFDSAWWITQILETMTEIRYDDICKDIRKAFDELENEQMEKQSEVEQKALQIYKEESREAMINFLTAFTNGRCELALETGKELIFQLFAKYRDGNPGRTDIPDEWKELLLKDDPATYFKLDETLEYKLGGRVFRVENPIEGREEDQERIKMFAF